MGDKVVQHPRRDMKLERDITRSPEAQALQEAIVPSRRMPTTSSAAA